MIVLCWNVEGLNDPSKQREVKKLIRDRRADLVYLVETKVRDWNALQIKEALFLNWGFLNNYDNLELGRIWVCWNTNIFHVSMVLKDRSSYPCWFFLIPKNGKCLLFVVQTVVLKGRSYDKPFLGYNGGPEICLGWFWGISMLLKT